MGIYGDALGRGAHLVLKAQFRHRLFQMFPAEMGVDHRHLDVGMAEQFLHRDQIHAVHHHMTGKGMPQDMGCEIGNPCLLADHP